MTSSEICIDLCSSEDECLPEPPKQSESKSKKKRPIHILQQMHSGPGEDGSDSDIEVLHVQAGPPVQKKSKLCSTGQKSEYSRNVLSSLEELGKDSDEDSFDLQPSGLGRSTPSKTPPLTKSTPKSTYVNPYLRKKTTLIPLENDVLPTSRHASPLKRRQLNPYLRKECSEPTRHTSPLPSLCEQNKTIQDPVPLSLQYPMLLDNSKKYPDIRPTLSLIFWKQARKFVHHSKDQMKFDQHISKLVQLSLDIEHPVRSIEEYTQRRNLSSRTYNMSKRLGMSNTTAVKETWDSLAANPLIPLVAAVGTTNHSNISRKYFTIAEAALVATLEFVEERFKSINNREFQQSQSSVLQLKNYWVSLKDIMPMIDARLAGVCPSRITRNHEEDNGESHYNKQSTRSAEYKQVQKLCIANEWSTSQQANTNAHQLISVSYLKNHYVGGKTHFELTLRGLQTANYLRSREYPATPGHYRTSNLTTVPSEFNGICLAVDRQEGGGPKHSLHKMCNKLDMVNLPYIVGSLSVGDYLFFKKGKLCPLLVERKSIQDVALSVDDGRWESQKRRMQRGQYVFGYDVCRIAFIIEGKEERQEVTGGYIGHARHGVTREKLATLVAELEQEGFDVLRTSCPENSMFELGKWARRVLREEVQGVMTYQEFKDALGCVPATTDFSRLAKAAMANRKSKASLNELRAGILNDATQQSRTLKICPDPAPVLENFDAGAQRKPAIDYSVWKTAALKQQCREWGVPQTGSKSDLIQRLHGPRRPQVLMERERCGQYAPKRHNIGACALLVGLVVEQQKHNSDGYKGDTKDSLYIRAESLNITKNPFSGGTTQTGPYHYDGWTNMKELLCGDPPLVCRLKGGRYKLTTCGPISGFPIAKAVHKWCHEHKKCSCQDLGYTFNSEEW